MAADDQAACPFCRAVIAADLLRFGGHCPKCLIEIPGEETPTDPGAEARMRAHAEERAAHAAGRRVRVLVGVLAFLALGAVGAWLGSRPEPEPLEPMDDDWAMVPLSKHKDQSIAGQGKIQSTKKTRSSRKSSHSSSSSTVASAGSGSSAPESTPAQGSIIPKPGADLAKDPLGAFSLNVGPASKMPDAIVLTDAGQIESMIQQVLTRGSKQLQQCYEQQLNEDEGLKGAWHVVFVIGTQGTTSEIYVTPLSTANPGLESCMLRNVRAWKFQRINEPIEINKTFRFSPSF